VGWIKQFLAGGLNKLIKQCEASTPPSAESSFNPSRLQHNLPSIEGFGESFRCVASDAAQPSHPTERLFREPGSIVLSTKMP
jgi:hypothetical protein